MSNLEIGTFQIKYVQYAGDWDIVSVADTILAIGEPVMVIEEKPDSTTSFYLYLGDGKSSLRQLCEANKFTQLGGYIQLPGTTIKSVKSDGTSNSAGSSNAYARADHQHTLDRTISYGSAAPAGGNVGDIYIQIES